MKQVFESMKWKYKMQSGNYKYSISLNFCAYLVDSADEEQEVIIASVLIITNIIHVWESLMRYEVW